MGRRRLAFVLTDPARSPQPAALLPVGLGPPDRGGRIVVALSTELAPWREPLGTALGTDGYSVVEAGTAGAAGAGVVLVTAEQWPALRGSVARPGSPRVVVVAEPECAGHDHARLVEAVDTGAAAYVCGATPRLVAALIRAYD